MKDSYFWYFLLSIHFHLEFSIILFFLLQKLDSWISNTLLISTLIFDVHKMSQIKTERNNIRFKFVNNKLWKIFKWYCSESRSKSFENRDIEERKQISTIYYFYVNNEEEFIENNVYPVIYVQRWDWNKW